MEAIQKDADALRPILADLRFSNEISLLDQFDKRFSSYRALDRTILDLAVENTNLKAQRLSFGPAQETADAFRAALEAVGSGAPASDSWHIQALTGTAIAAVREIEVLEAPHIAEPNDGAMTRIEERMSTSEGAARNALKTLATLVQPVARPQIVAGEAALNKFLDLNTQIIALSRRNSNVRSLALSLGQKRMLTAQCENDLRALKEAIDRRGFVATR